MIVYTVVVTYNGVKWIQTCLNSLLESLYPTQIIVVDNNSSDGTADLIAQNYPDLELLRSGVNLGFGQANNIGIRRALESSCDFVFLLNQDASVEQATIGSLVAFHAGNSQIGILSPLHFEGKKKDLDRDFEGYLKDGTPYTTMEKTAKSRLPCNAVSCEFVNAAAWLISKTCLEKAGGFDPIFFHYGEDSNLAQRVLQTGLLIVILEDVRIYHDRPQHPAKFPRFTSAGATRDHIQFLVYATDLKRASFRTYMLREFLKNSLSTIKASALLRKDECMYFFKRTFKIARSYRHVRRSRRLYSLRSPYLFL